MSEQTNAVRNDTLEGTSGVLPDRLAKLFGLIIAALQLGIANSLNLHAFTTIAANKAYFVTWQRFWWNDDIIQNVLLMSYSFTS